MFETIGVWIAAIVTIGIFSFLYKDNPFYKLIEHIGVGVSAGYMIVLLYYQTFLPKLWYPLVKGNILQKILIILPTILGVMFFARFSPKLGWMARWPVAFIWGLGAGAVIPLSMQGMIIKQLRATMVPVALSVEGINNIIIIAGVFCGILYFFFSKEHKGTVGFLAMIGVYIIMMGFGASFGLTVMSRISLLIGRINFLFRDWLGILK